MVHYCDKAMLVTLDEFLKSACLVGTDAKHEANVRVAERHLRTGLADRYHARASACVRPAGIVVRSH